MFGRNPMTVQDKFRIGLYGIECNSQQVVLEMPSGIRIGQMMHGGSLQTIFWQHCEGSFMLWTLPCVG